MNKLLRFLAAGIPAFLLAIPLNWILVDHLAVSKPMAYGCVLLVQVTINFFACVHFVFERDRSRGLFDQYLAFMGGILAARCLDWGIYTLVVQHTAAHYLVVQVLNALVFSVLKFTFARRAIEGQDRIHAGESGPNAGRAGQPSRWFTCTPVAVGGGEDFFARDSGLLCRGFQSLGVDSRAVMPLPGGADDLPDLLRTEYRNLESADWWKLQRLDGVVLYAWGSPRYRKIAAAIKDAGIFLVLNQDSGGLVSPLAGPLAWLHEQYLVAGAGRTQGGWRRFLIQVVKGWSTGLLVTDPLRAAHLRSGDVIAAVSPLAAERYRRLCKIYGGARLSARVRVVPHAVAPGFAYHGQEKQEIIAVVGRWDDERQKRTSLMQEVVARVLTRHPRVQVMIGGSRTDGMARWWDELDPAGQARVTLMGRVLPGVLADLFAKARVLYCPSAFESFHIASAEALCSGCSVVGARLPCMAAFPWFCGRESGTLAEIDTPDGHVAAISAELEAWSQGRRDPEAIARYWQQRLHAPEIARSILEMPARLQEVHKGGDTV